MPSNRLLITNSTFDKCRCALNGNNSMRQFGLNNALMLAYAFAGSFKDTALIHASLVRQNGKGYAFTAKSGTGKSTHVGLWLKHLPGCDLMRWRIVLKRIHLSKLLVMYYQHVRQ